MDEYPAFTHEENEQAKLAIRASFEVPPSVRIVYDDTHDDVFIHWSMDNCEDYGLAAMRCVLAYAEWVLWSERRKRMETDPMYRLHRRRD